MEEFLGHLTVFVLACFVGWQVIWKVTPALHTPLMSGSNAISGISIVGALVIAGSGESMLFTMVGLAAVNSIDSHVPARAGSQELAASKSQKP